MKIVSVTTVLLVVAVMIVCLTVTPVQVQADPIVEGEVQWEVQGEVQQQTTIDDGLPTGIDSKFMISLVQSPRRID